MRNRLNGIVETPTKQRYQKTRHQEKAQYSNPPSHVHAVLVHGREYEHREPTHDLPEEGDQSHNFGLLSLGDEGDGQRALAGEHPTERDAQETRVDVHQNLILIS